MELFLCCCDMLLRANDEEEDRFSSVHAAASVDDPTHGHDLDSVADGDDKVDDRRDGVRF